MHYFPGKFKYGGGVKFDMIGAQRQE